MKIAKAILKFNHWLTHPYRIYRFKKFLFSFLSFYIAQNKNRGLIGFFKRPKNLFLNKNQTKLIFLFSSCEGSLVDGDLKYNGGLKIYNLWVKLLREHGYEAYIVTYKGDYQPWLIEHQPCISIATVKEWIKEKRHLKFVTSWLDAKIFIGLAEQVYFYDCEVAHTSTIHSSILKKLMKSKIRAIATNSRFQQAWYMANFKFTPLLIPEWSDEKYWFPKKEKRRAGLVGYMRESLSSKEEIEEIDILSQKAGVKLKFVEVKGNEKEVINTMQQCDFYLGLNPGKDSIWGEGCPRSQQEAIHTGCVLIAYDVHGNREYLIDGYTGFLAPPKRPDILAEHLIMLSKNPGLKEQIRARSIDLANRAFSSSGRWPFLSEFLEIGGKAFQILSRSDLEFCLGAPAYITDEEISVFSKYAAKSEKTLVEVGAGYGASTVLIITNAPSSAKIYSIDPFIKDSMGNFQSSAKECYGNVSRALKIMQKPNAFERWHLYAEPSYKVVNSWKESIDFLYIDGDHRYEAVRRDFNDWFPFVRKGAYILLHDSCREPNAPKGEYARGWPGPTRLAKELEERNNLKLIDKTFSLTVWKKIEN